MTDKLNTLQLATLPVVTAEQLHGSSIGVTEETASQCFLGCDGVITALPNVLLLLRTADCMPILISHPSGLIGALHAGRRGTQQHILAKAMQLIKEKWHLDKDLRIWFGPAICVSCYQINPQTNEHFDLLAENQQQLESEIKLAENQLIISQQCTLELPEQYHSYRRTGKGVPMNYSGIANLV